MPLAWPLGEWLVGHFCSQLPGWVGGGSQVRGWRRLCPLPGLRWQEAREAEKGTSGQVILCWEQNKTRCQRNCCLLAALIKADLHFYE